MVLGMHRSGTSALTGCLAELGIHLGQRLLEPASDNAKGYFENADAVTIDERLLAHLGRAWDDYRALPDGWLAAPEAIGAQTQAIALIRNDLASRGVWALKDPRLCLLLPLWREAWRSMSTTPLSAILVLRHPFEVARSLERRDRLPATLGLLLWFRYLEDAIVNSAGMRRAWVSYDELLADPVAALAAIGDTLQLSWPLSPDHAEAALCGFLSPGQRHHRAGDGECLEACDPTLAALAVELHEALLHAAGDDAHEREARTRFDALRCWQSEHASWLDALDHLRHAASLHSSGDIGRHHDERALMRQRIGELQHALSDAETLALERLRSVEASVQRVVQSEAAQAEAERIAHERLELVGQSLQHAVEAERIAHERLAQIAACNDRISSLETLVHERTRQVEALDAQLALTQGALADATRVVEVNRGDLQALQRRLLDTEAAYAYAESLALARLAEIETLAEQNHVFAQRIHAQEEDLQRISAENAALTHTLAIKSDDLSRIDRSRVFRGLAALRLVRRPQTGSEE